MSIAPGQRRRPATALAEEADHRHTARTEHPAPPPPLITLRSAVIFTLGIISGSAATALTALAGTHIAAAVLAGLAALGAAITFFNKVID